MEHYAKRKEWQLKTMSNELLMISNQARFYELVTEGKLTGSVSTYCYFLKHQRAFSACRLTLCTLQTHPHTQK